MRSQQNHSNLQLTLTQRMLTLNVPKFVITSCRECSSFQFSSLVDNSPSHNPRAPAPFLCHMSHGDKEEDPQLKSKMLRQRQLKKQEAEVEKLKEYAGHGFRYGGSQSQINKMKMKEKQAEQLEE